jgi:hypothetical protein
MGREMKWRIAATGDRELWGYLSRESDGATFFHTPVWAEILESTFDAWKAATSAVEFSDGNAVVLPQMQWGLLGPIARYTESMLPGVYGGPLFLQTPNEEHWQAVWDIVNSLSDIIVLGNPYLPYVGQPNAIRRPMLTQVLELTRGFDSIWKGFRKGHRAGTKAAEREGVEVKVATSRQEVDAYAESYGDALRRWGTQARGFYPKRLFHNLFQHQKYGEAIRLWVARLNGKVVGGAWVFYHNNHAVYWHGAVHSAYMTYHPAHLLVTTAIEEACREGFRWFDLNPSGGLQGVEHFKSGFGAQRMSFYTYRRLSFGGKAFRLYRYLRERCLRRCSL